MRVSVRVHVPRSLADLDHLYVRGRHARAQDLAHTQLVTDAKAAECLAQPLDRQPRIDERAEDHVARGAGKTIEVEHARHQSPFGPSIEQ